MILLKVEVVIPDQMLDPVIDAILAAAKTEKIGDGKVFVSTIDKAIRIRIDMFPSNEYNYTLLTHLVQ